MITAIVERWRLETHIFHPSVGEATITLRDVAILTDLPIRGEKSLVLVRAILKSRYVGCSGSYIGSPLKLLWMLHIIDHLLTFDAEDVYVKRYVGNYCWVLVSGYLFVNKSINKMQGIFLELLIKACVTSLAIARLVLHFFPLQTFMSSYYD
ncbi:protein MAIN-LIKE 2-like [Amaranthus tricolor]|uniref:protein MAIN-LIKE 2-like n=1 Tax=Amaranthus tricolor TaxID=29722 RepID=UPI0025826D42|nr:protein MAIN-LIKE 2-like [Amaranthus tricolor]